MSAESALLTWAVAALAFFAGGLVKGVLGIGLPLVAVPVMSTVMAPTQAISLTVVPIILANLWQAWEGRYGLRALRRFWPVIAALVLVMLPAGRLLVSIEQRLSELFMGAVLIGFCLFQLSPWQPRIASRHERWLGPAVGAFAGVVGGVTSLYGSIIVAYLLALRLPKDEFVGTIAVFYLAGSGALYLLLAAYGELTGGIFAGSALMLLPMLLGLLLGRGLRYRLSQRRFHLSLIAVLLLIGISLCLRGAA